MIGKWKQKAVYACLVIGRIVLNIIYFFHKAVPVRDRISFVSRQSREPSVDVQMLAAELKRQSPDTEIVISCRMIDPGFPARIRYFFYMITTQMHLFATSKVVILDGYCIGACMLHHKKDLKIVQMWHAMGAFKRFGYSGIGEAEGRSDVLAKGMCMHRNYDVIFISSEACRVPMSMAFGCDPGRMEVMPLPRTDLIRDRERMEEARGRILKRYPQLSGKRVVLYAPTFRRNRRITSYAVQLAECFDPDSGILVLKLHPLDRGEIASDHILTDTEFTSLEFLSIAEDVITDYSAFIYEAAYAGKRIYRYVPDDHVYDSQRGFLVDLEQEFPFFYSAEPEKIAEALKEQRCDMDDVRKFSDKYVEPGQHHTKNMAEYVLKLAEAAR